MENCIFIPVHPAKSNWLFTFLNSVARHHDSSKNHDFCIVLGTTNYIEFEFFSRLRQMMPETLDIRFFITEDYLLDCIGMRVFHEKFVNNKDGCIVNAKKLIGLHWCLTKKIDTILLVDSDLIALADLSDIFNLANLNHDRAQYFGCLNDVQLFSAINKSCCSFFSEEHAAIIKEMTKTFSVYTWFFDVPVYKSSSLAGFFAYMEKRFESNDQFFSNLSNHSFDHIIYTFWRCISEEAVIINYSDVGIYSIPETMTIHDTLRVQQKYNYSPIWVTCKELFNAFDLARSIPNLRMGYHFDRF